MAHASESGQMSQMVGQTDGQVQERLEWQTKNHLEHWTEKCPEWNRLEG
jgi:hypothetical protein